MSRNHTAIFSLVRGQGQWLIKFCAFFTQTKGGSVPTGRCQGFSGVATFVLTRRSCWTGADNAPATQLNVRNKRIKSETSVFFHSRCSRKEHSRTSKKGISPAPFSCLMRFAAQARAGITQQYLHWCGGKASGSWSYVAFSPKPKAVACQPAAARVLVAW